MHHDSRRHIVHEDEADNGTSSLDTRLIWAGLFFALAIFSKAPGLDLTVAAKYYSAQAGFFHADDPLVRVLYEWTPNTGRGLVILMLVYALIAPLISKWFAARGKTDLARKSAGPWRHSAVLVVCCALLGPGLLIEGLLKDTMGRPRPLHIEQFGGTEVFHGPFELGADTKRHRSFVSSHAAAGFALMSLGLNCGPVWRRRWLLVGVVTGGIIGLGRMMQGAHFLSDIVFAFYGVWLSCELVAWIDRRLQHGKPRPPAARGSGRYPAPRQD
jgi:lipid A 4'-phosphatase